MPAVISATTAVGKIYHEMAAVSASSETGYQILLLNDGKSTTILKSIEALESSLLGASLQFNDAFLPPARRELLQEGLYRLDVLHRGKIDGGLGG